MVFIQKQLLSAGYLGEKGSVMALGAYDHEHSRGQVCRCKPALVIGLQNSNYNPIVEVRSAHRRLNLGTLCVFQCLNCMKNDSKKNGWRKNS